MPTLKKKAPARSSAKSPVSQPKSKKAKSSPATSAQPDLVDQLIKLLKKDPEGFIEKLIERISQDPQMYIPLIEKFERDPFSILNNIRRKLGIKPDPKAYAVPGDLPAPTELDLAVNRIRQVDLPDTIISDLEDLFAYAFSNKQFFRENDNLRRMHYHFLAKHNLRVFRAALDEIGEIPEPYQYTLD